MSPIKPENKTRYPADWKQIRERILARAGNRCEGSPDYPDCRAVNGADHPVTGSRVVLTIAHLNHIPEDCREENLRAWCQRCHLNYDRKARIQPHVTITHPVKPWKCGCLKADCQNCYPMKARNQ